jgi:anthranilate phosphoribosyltransferase
MIVAALQKLLDGKELSPKEVTACVQEIVEGRASEAQVGAFLVAFRQKGERPSEIASFASALAAYSHRISPQVDGRLLDTCGTGGDKLKTLNVSTVSAIVAAGAGARVAKHGNRSVTSRCGSADLLEKLGFNLNMEPEKVKMSIEEVGIGFLFAPTFHPAMKTVAPIRKELGIRTIFNLVGPLVNPANANARVLGVYSPGLVPVMSDTLRRMGTEEAMVVHSVEGMDEISVTGRTLVSWLKDGNVTTREYLPEEMGIKSRHKGLPEVNSVEDSAKLTLNLLSGDVTDAASLDLVLVNSAAALTVSGRAEGLADGVEMARQSIESGAAYRKLRELILMSGGDDSQIELYARNK